MHERECAGFVTCVFVIWLLSPGVHFCGAQTKEINKTTTAKLIISTSTEASTTTTSFSVPTVPTTRTTTTIKTTTTTLSTSVKPGKTTTKANVETNSKEKYDGSEEIEENPTTTPKWEVPDSVRTLVTELTTRRTLSFPGDHVFVLDISGSVFDGDKAKYDIFITQTLRQFIWNTLLIHPDYARVAVVTFADDINVVLDGVSVSDSIYTACDLFSTEYGIWNELDFGFGGLRTNTMITSALEKVREILKEGEKRRPGKVWRQTVWVFTDGWDSLHIEFSNATRNIITRLESSGADIFAVSMPSHDQNLTNVRSLVSSSSHFITNEEFTSLAIYTDRQMLKGSESKFAKPRGNCTLLDYCGRNASCYCDCLTAEYKCVCDAGYEQLNSQCEKCSVHLSKPAPGNHSCEACADIYDSSCQESSTAAYVYLGVAGATVAGIGIISLFIFFLVYVLKVRRDRERRSHLVPPPSKKEVCSTSVGQEKQDRPIMNHGYANKEMLAFHPDVVHSALKTAASIEKGIYVGSHGGTPVSQHRSPRPARPTNWLERTPDDHYVTDISRYSPSPSSPRSPTPSQVSACSGNLSPASTNTYVMPLPISPDVPPSTSPPTLVDEHGYVVPVAYDSDVDEYVNASVSNLNIASLKPKPKQLTAGQYLTPDVGDQNDGEYVNQSELNAITASARTLVKSDKKPGSGDKVMKKAPPKPLAKPKNKGQATAAVRPTENVYDNQNRMSVKPKPGTVAELKNALFNSADTSKDNTDGTKRPNQTKRLQSPKNDIGNPTYLKRI